MPGLVVGGTSSHCGKTVTTLALICALRARHLRVAAAKIGPDFIDTAYHQQASGLPVANLDIWMQGARGLARLQKRMAQLAPGLCVAEGVMGLFDGTTGGRGSTAHVACQLDWPVLLLLPCKGQAQSVAAVAEGFLTYGEGRRGIRKPRFAGMLCTFVGGERHKALLREALAPVAQRHKVPLLGMLPREGAPQLPSRHLGLVAAEETAHLLEPDALATWFADNCDMAALLRALGLRRTVHADNNVPALGSSGQTSTQHDDCGQQAFFAPAIPCTQRTLRVGIAFDAAFRFCYADVPALLQELGAEVRFFSPLQDAAPPAHCAGLYFPGGYPELFAQQLAANRPMRESLRTLASQNVPMYGECGGFLYLMRELVDNEGHSWPMTGLLPLACRMGRRWAALGYRLCEGTYRGHEFHYGQIEDAPTAPAPLCSSHKQSLWQSVKNGSGQELGPQGCRIGNIAGSWVHLAPEGARGFWRAWLHSLRTQAIS